MEQEDKGFNKVKFLKMLIDVQMHVAERLCDM